MNVPAIILIILTMLFVIYYFCPSKSYEGFHYYPYRYNVYRKRPYWWNRYFSPYWNSYFGSRSIMPYNRYTPLHYNTWVPFNMSPHIPYW